MENSDREEAIELARQQLRNVLNSDLPAIEAVEKYQSFLRNDRHGYLSAGRLLELRRKLEARQLDQSDHDEIVLYNAAFGREGMQPPPWLAEYVAEVLEGKRVRPPGTAGRKSERDRDFALWMAVKLLVDQYGLQVYSNTHDDPEVADTACTLVSEAAAREGRAVSYSALSRMLSKKFKEVKL